MSKSDADQPEQQTLTEWTDHQVEAQRAAALAGGARYRQVASDAPSNTASISRTCENCGGHVSKQFVRVFGGDGTVDGCPSCLEGTEVLQGQAHPDLGVDR